VSDAIAPIQLQVIGASLRSIAEEMGAVLIRSSFSANIKERRDCSTALFDERGRMIAQAEHIPVHLGAMPDAVAAVKALGLEQGQVAILNDPFTGGTHLPDVTLVSRTVLGYAVSRAHHADVGGIEPASLPAFSHTLEEEGVILPPQLLSHEVLERFVQATRQPEERRGDLRAQLSAHRLAELRLDELCARRGRNGVVAAMDELYSYSERMVRAAIAELPNGRGEAEDVVEAVDGDLSIRCTAEIVGDGIRLDFTGTAPQYDGNLNCPLAVTKSACYFVVRCVTEPDLPASGGAFAPVSVTAPEGCFVNARSPAAVVAGNTETSSRIVDVVFAALGELVPVPAAGQGTMNNLAFGSDRFTYYETVGGGQGACPDADGPSGVHIAMSNTLATPAEAIELEYPLRVERWELRPGSGGAGARQGGDGVVRELRVLEDCRLSVLAERRRHAPPGRAGGEDGARGLTLINGEVQPPKLTRQLHAGDVVRIESPGGGGYGGT
jgi:N-methylhydantoinase B